MDYTQGKVVKELAATEPTRRIDIVARDDGSFQCYEQIAIAGRWSPGRVSGLYNSAEHAEQDARDTFLKKFDYSAMNTSERLFVAGLLEEFDVARRERNRSDMMRLLSKVDLADHAAQIVDSILVNPSKYGR